MAVDTAAATRRILIADPDPAARAALCRVLVEQGFDVIEARDGQQALELYRSLHPDLVVLERVLPGLDSFTVARSIQALEEGTASIIFSGYGGSEDELNAVFRAGAQDYLRKPHEPEELKARLRHAMDSSRRTRQLLEQNIALESEVFAGQRHLEQTNVLLNVQLLNQQALLDMSQQLSASIDLDEQIHILLLTVMGHMGIDAAAIFTVRGEDQRIQLHAARGVESEGIAEVELHEEKAFLRYITADNGPLMLRDLPLGVATGPHLSRLLELGFVAGMPIHAGERLRGLLLLGPKAGDQAMTDSDRALLASLAVSTGIAMDKAELFRKLQETYVATIQSLMTAMEARDTYTRGHTARVSRYSLAVGRELGFTKDALRDLKFGSTLHDIGKIGIADGILNKTGSLSAEEMQIMQQHPALGERILRQIEFLENARRIVRSHHERIDGKGYPDGLVGDEISLGARIVAIVDSFDAMTSTRTYSEGMGMEEAIWNLTSKAGTQFDPAVVEVFVELLRRGEVAAPTWLKP